MSSGFSPVATVPSGLSVFRSKIVTVLPRPLLMKPLFSSAAIAIPWTPGVSGMSPTTLLESRSTTATCVPCETYGHRGAGRGVRGGDAEEHRRRERLERERRGDAEGDAARARRARAPADEVGTGGAAALDAGALHVARERDQTPRIGAGERAGARG